MASRRIGEQTLNHLYFANTSPLRQLIAQASGRAPEPVGRRPQAGLAGRPLTAPPLAAVAETEAGPGAAVEPGRTIALTVIPFQE